LGHERYISEVVGFFQQPKREKKVVALNWPLLFWWSF